VIFAPPPSLVPTAIGLGPKYRPPALVRDGRALGSVRCTEGGARYGVHLELFAHRRVVIVPRGIGVARGCSYDARTRTPTGVIEVRRASKLKLADLFRIWDQPLGRFRLVGFTSKKPLLAFVGGRRWRGDPRDIPLAYHAQIVVELDGYVPPHPSFLFPGGLR
jgi:hypothetical protein